MKKQQTSQRRYRIADQIQRDLSYIITTELKNPQIMGMLTISRVDITADYAHAKVYFTILQGEPQLTEETLNHSAGFLRKHLFKRLHIHTVPQLHFIFDRTAENATHMQALIAQAVGSPSQNT